MSNFVELVKLASSATEEQTRKQSEARLLEYIKTQPLNFIKDCVKNFGNKDIPTETRQMIGLILKKTIVSNSPGGNTTFWSNLNSGVQDEIKDLCLGQLIEQDMKIKMASGAIIAAIFQMGYKTNGWPQLLDNLSSNSKSDNLNIKASSIVTLGYICENFSSSSMKMNDKNEVEKILSGICAGLEKNNSNQKIIEISLKSLRDSLVFTADVLESENILKFVMEKVVECTMVKNIEIQIGAIQCLTELVSVAYKTLTDIYMKVFTRTITPFLGDEDTQIALTTIEFFASLARIEFDLIKPQNSIFEDSLKSKGFIKSHFLQILPPILKNLLRNDGELDEDVETSNSVVSSSRICLYYINSIVGKETLDVNKEFIGTFLAKNDKESKIASLCAYTAMIDGVPKEHVQEMVKKSINNLVGMIADDAAVNKAIFMVLLSIADRIPEFYFDGTITEDMFINKIMVRIRNSNVEIKGLCRILAKIGELMTLVSSKITFYHKKLVDFIKLLIDTSFSKDFSADLNVIEFIYSALFDLSKNIKPENIQEFIISQFKNFDKLSTVSKEQGKQIKEGIFLSINGSLWRLALTIDNGRQYLSNENIKNIYTVCLAECKNQDGFNPDTLNCIVAIGDIIQDDFIPLLDETMRMVSLALVSKNKEMIKVGLETMSSFIKSFQEKTQKYVQDFVKFIVKSLKDKSFYPELRSILFISLGDTALGSPGLFVQGINDILPLFTFAFEAVATILTSKDKAARSYGESLRDAVCESLICLIHACLYDDRANSASNKQLQKTFFDYSSKINSFINLTTRREAKPSMHYLYQCVSLSYDIQRYFKQINAGAVLNSMMIRKMIDVLYMSDEYRNTIASFDGLKETFM